MFSFELIVPRTLIFPGNLPAYYSFISSDLSTSRVVSQVGRLVEVLALALGAARSTEYVGILEIHHHIMSSLSSPRVVVTLLELLQGLQLAHPLSSINSLEVLSW